MLPGLVALFLALTFVWWCVRAGDLFVLSIRNGRVLVVSGRVPQAFVNDVRRIAEHASVMNGTIRASQGDHHARLRFSGGIDLATQQRVRNTFGLYPMAQLRRAPPIDNPTVGQILGIAWLAWMLDGFRR
jgi:hypothetical protein